MTTALQASVLGDKALRLRLQEGKKHQECVGRGRHLRYRRPTSGQAGRWSARWRDLNTGADVVTAIGTADDHTEADGGNVLSYAQALAAATQWFALQDTGGVEGIPAPKRPRVPPRDHVQVLSLDERRRLIDSASPALRQLVEAALYTGAHGAELTRSCVGDFNSAGRFIQVRSKRGGARRIYLTKSGHAWFTRVVAGRDSKDPMFQGEVHLGHAMAHALQQAGLQEMPFDDLRHTYAASLLEEGVSPFVVAKQLGHKDVRMVERHYGHLTGSVADRMWAASGALHAPMRKPKVRVKVVETIL